MSSERVVLFSIPSTKHLGDVIPVPKGSATFSQFSDGEWQVTVHDKVQGQTVWVLAQTGGSADCVLQLLLLCDALRRAGAQIQLCILYMGYGRQDKAHSGQPLGCQMMCRLLALCQAHTVHALHLHNPLVCSELIINHIPFAFFNECAHDADVIVAPDQGASSWAGHIAAAQFKQLICIEKQRSDSGHMNMTLSGDVRGKHALIIDDIISTSRTIVHAAQLLFEHGALSVRVAATHGVFAGDAIKHIEDSLIEKIYVTNSLLQEQTSAKIILVDIAPFIAAIIKG